MNIYLASSWRNPHHSTVLADLREAGHTVYDFKKGAPFRWLDVDVPEHPSLAEFCAGLKKPAAQRGYAQDFRAMEAADVFVLLLPCGKSAHLEAGWAAGRDKPVVICAEAEGIDPELMYLLSPRFTTRDRLVETLHLHVGAPGPIIGMTEDGARVVLIDEPGTVVGPMSWSREDAVAFFLSMAKVKTQPVAVALNAFKTAQLEMTAYERDAVIARMQNVCANELAGIAMDLTANALRASYQRDWLNNEKAITYARAAMAELGFERELLVVEGDFPMLDDEDLQSDDGQPAEAIPVLLRV